MILDLTSFRVLHVEDDVLQRRQMASLLGPRFGEFESAATGGEGLEKFLAAKPDLVISDLSMPIMNGLEMAAEIRRECQEVPIIITTVLGDAELVLEAINLGVNRYVMKPIEPVKLMSAIEDCLGVLAARRRIDEQNEQLRALIAQREEFLGMAAHDLRNPAAVVIGMADLLIHSEPTADQLELLTMIKDSGEYMARLLGDLLDLNRIESGRLELACAPVDLCAFLQGIVKENRVVASQYGVSLELEMEEGEVVCSIDADRMRQVMTNLLANAYRFTPRGGEVVISIGQKESSVCIAVADGGPGIPDTELEKVFIRGESGTDRDGKKSTGLGLPIARRVLLEHGGDLVAGNATGGGAVFTLTLPQNVTG